ncbi:MAG: ribonuclease H-like domain-containing protein [bacterium]|nr:ribonuclease H-like domain-containing protein [bacterium]
MDTLVFDIETQNFFTSPGVGWDNFEALKISVVGVYSYAQDKYFCYEEHEMDALAELFRSASRTVGFSSNRYDTPVLNFYFKRHKQDEMLDLWSKERVDLLAEIEQETGKRISLSKLAAANLGVSKGMHGSEAIGLYEQGRIDELKEYCLKDVELTKKLYDMYRTQGYFLIPDRDSGKINKVMFPSAYALPASLF